MNELAKKIEHDGQPLRALLTYLNETYDGVKNKDLFDVKFTTEEEFFNYVKGVCDFALKIED